MDYQQIITIEPGKRSGKPCIRGMRITVYDILEYFAGGMTSCTEVLILAFELINKHLFLSIVRKIRIYSLRRQALFV